MKKVLLGFSGGVDSTASAVVLRDGGYDVRLLMLDTTGNLQQVEKARSVAEKLDMPLEITDVRKPFREAVVDYFIDGYCRGETPAPCSVCNERVKWKTLYDKALEYCCDHIATGHYFRVKAWDGNYYVREGADPVKDQSYFLWSLPQKYLAMALTPMGDKLKNDIKQAYDHLVDEAESMGVCFLDGKSYGDFLRSNVPSIKTGQVKDKAGNMVGTHNGCALYTTGQKKGFECSVPGAVVVGIDASENTLTVGTDADLYSSVLELERCRVVNLPRLLGSDGITVKIRGIGRNPQGSVSVTVRSNEVIASPNTVRYMDMAPGCEDPLEDGDTSPWPNNELRLRVELSDPAWAAAKGQPVVFYEGDVVLGGGYLKDYR